MADSSLVSALRSYSSMQATPRNEFLGVASDLMNNGLNYLDSKGTKISILADILRGTGVPKTVERMAYGEPLTNIGSANVPLLKPETADFAMTVAPMIGPAARGAGKVVGNAVNDAMVYGQGPLASMTPQPMRMFIGESANTWDNAAAMQAKALEKQGKTPQEIWKETGTFKGVDGKYRQEIPDTSMKLVDTLSDNLANKRNIDRYFEHKPLYEAYPDARQIKFMPTDSMPSGNADWTPSQNLIRLGQGEGFSSVTPSSNTLHELQHAIQQKEGWQTGGSSLTGLDDAYRNLAGEAEARATQERMSMDAAQRRAIFPLDSYDVPINQLIVK
jgi:hypothetical protein